MATFIGGYDTNAQSSQAALKKATQTTRSTKNRLDVSAELVDDSGNQITSANPLPVDIGGSVSLTATLNRSVTVTSATGSGAISTSTSIGVDALLNSVTVHFGSAPTTSEDLTVTLNALDGSAYDTVLKRVDPSVGAKTDIVFIPDGDLLLEAGDEIDVAFTNTDAVTYGIRIVTEAI